MKTLLKFVLSLAILMSFSITTEAATTKVWWDGAELKQGQIGRVTILSDIRATKIEIVNPDYPTHAINFKLDKNLKRGEVYRVYSFKSVGDRKFYGLGGGLYVQRTGNVYYQTPSKAKLELANKK